MVPVVISTLNIILPFLFEFLAQIEQFKTRSGEIKMTLLRAILVRVSSLVVLIITDYTLIKCTQPGGSGGQGGADQCSLSGLNILGSGSNTTGTTSTACKIEVCSLLGDVSVSEVFHPLVLGDLHRTRLIQTCFNQLCCHCSQHTCV